MTREQVIARLRACADDPMWADHAEVSKATLHAALNLLDGRPVAWMHDGENRLDICHATIKQLLIDAKCGKQVAHYTIPLYLGSTVPVGVHAVSPAQSKGGNSDGR